MLQADFDIWFMLYINSDNMTVVPPKEDHLHVSAGQNFSDSSDLCQVATDLLNLLLCGDWVQLIALVSIWWVKIISGWLKLS